MCGIAGIWGREPPAARREAWESDVRAMLAAIRHRGPDESRVVSCSSGVLGVCRLAVIDPAGGSQPMRTADGRHVVALNGAIVNHVELRPRLAAAGAAFRTECDTESALHGLALHGPAFFGEMNGMFAVAWFDDERGSALLARDPCGIKPLYWLDEGDRVLFASEIKGILAAARRRPGTCRSALLDYLAFQVPLDDRTFFEGVRRVPPNSMLRLERGREPRIDSLPVWTSPAPVTEDADDAAAQLREILDDAVRIHLRADVPAGAHLSGGLDSSYVAARAAARIGRGMAVFTGAFDEPGFDERPHARAVAEEIGATMIVSVPGPADLLDALPRVVRAMDEPAAGPGLLPQWFVARSASGTVKVVLGGQGGDELFSGYVRHLILRFEAALGVALRGGDTRALRAVAPHLSSLDGYEPLLRRHFASGMFGPVPERVFSLVHRGGGLPLVLGPDLREELRLHPARERFLAAFEASSPLRADGTGDVNRAARFDRHVLLPALLQVEDRTSMAWSVESRVPLLDRRVLSFVDGASDAVLFGDGGLKHLFRRATETHLPAAARRRTDKMGFPVPLAAWARDPEGPLGRGLREILHAAGGGRGILDPAAIPGLLAGESVEARHLWALLNIELWHRTFQS